MNTNIITIKNDYLTVQVNPFGAELWSIKDRNGKEYLWQGDPQYWDSKSPTIFPYVGRLYEKSCTVNGETYHMDVHGFAKDTLFEIVKLQKDMVTLQIGSSEETLAQYPFRFTFRITYRLINNRLDVEFQVNNTDSRMMYFGLGGHPGFHVPLSENLTFEDYYIEFSEESTPSHILFSDDCFVLEGQTTPFPLENGKRYSLHHDMFDADAIVLTDMPRQVTLGSDRATEKVRVTYPDMDYLGLWHMPGTDAPYICIEPWSSLPARKGMIEDLEKQDNLISLPSGEIYSTVWSIEIM